MAGTLSDKRSYYLFFSSETLSSVIWKGAVLSMTVSCFHRAIFIMHYYLCQRISRWKISIIAPIRLILATAASASRLKIVAFIPAHWHSHWLWWAVALDLLFYQWFSVANHKPAQISLVWTTGSMKRTYGFYDSYVFIHFLVGFNNETLLSSTFRECNFESHQRHNKNGRALKKNVEIDEWSWVITEGHRFVRNTFFWFDCVAFLREFSLTTPQPPFIFFLLLPSFCF